MEYVAPFFWWGLWLLKQLVLLIWWTWPITLVSWPLTFISIVGAYLEYRKSGGGVWNAVKVSWRAMISLPETALNSIRVIASVVIAVIRASGRGDPVEHMPEWLRKFLAVGTTHVRTGERVEVPVPGMISFQQRTRIFMFSGLIWVPLTLAFVFWVTRG